MEHTGAIHRQILCMRDSCTADPSRETIRQLKFTHKQRAASKGHTVEKVGSHYQCMQCGQSWRPRDTRRFMPMSRGDCFGAGMYDTNLDLSRPWTLPMGTRVQIGKGRTHRTHHMRWFRGVFYCAACGYWGRGEAHSQAGRGMYSEKVGSSEHEVRGQNAPGIRATRNKSLATRNKSLAATR